jgi:hypothetical protein
MNDTSNQVSLGFTDQTFPAGVHICQIYSSNEERLDSLLKFLYSGLSGGERTACLAENLSTGEIENHISRQGMTLDEHLESGALTLANPNDVYFRNDVFDPDYMLDLLRTMYENATAKGFRHTRIIGEMLPRVTSISGGSRLMEYESRVSMLLREFPVTAVCQYDANRFDGATIMRVLKVHPLMVIRGAVINNPYFVPPEEVLASCC